MPINTEELSMFKLLISITLASSLLVLNACEANGPKYRNVRSFSEGLAPVQSNNGKWGYINERQKFIIQPKFEDAKEFQGGKAPAKKNDKWGFINKRGEWL